MTEERIFTNLRTFLQHTLEKELTGKKISPSRAPPENWPKDLTEGQIKRVYYYPEAINLEVMFEGNNVHVFDLGLRDFEYYKIL